MFWKKKANFLKMSDCVGRNDGRDFLVVGAGGTLKEYEGAIKKFIKDKGVLTIGINKMTGICVPDYHLWTNRQRWRDLGDCISEKSTMMFGRSLHERPKLIRKHYKGDYILVDNERTDGGEVEWREGVIYGSFRTAGVLAVMVCYLLGAREIYIAGMDGYTLHGREKIEGGSESQHFYGKGFTDDSSWEDCVEKDKQVYEELRKLNAFGVGFRIITPTKFEDYYDGGILSGIDI